MAQFLCSHACQEEGIGEEQGRKYPETTEVSREDMIFNHVSELPHVKFLANFISGLNLCFHRLSWTHHSVKYERLPISGLWFYRLTEEIKI